MSKSAPCMSKGSQAGGASRGGQRAYQSKLLLLLLLSLFLFVIIIIFNFNFIVIIVIIIIVMGPC